VDESDLVRVTRRELYDQIWSRPVSRVCQAYGISDVTLARVCAEFSIPHPPRGYWAKKRAGRTVRRPRLRPLSADPADEVLEFRVAPRPPALPPEVAERVAAERRPENRITVLERLTNPHVLVDRTERRLRSARPDEVGFVAPAVRGCLDLAVAPGTVDRALRVLDALVKALDARGLRVAVRDDGPGRRSEVLVAGERIGFRLSEDTERVERPATADERDEDLLFHGRVRPRYRRIPDGRLVLRITDGQALRRCWSDRADRRVEGFLNSFVAGLTLAAEDQKRERAKAAEWARRRDEEERERQAADRRRQDDDCRRRDEEARLQDLLNQAAAWARAEQVRAYVDAVCRAAGDRRAPAPPGVTSSGGRNGPGRGPMSWTRSSA
jgi:hypothetical protein